MFEILKSTPRIFVRFHSEKNGIYTKLITQKDSLFAFRKKLFLSDNVINYQNIFAHFVFARVRVFRCKFSDCGVRGETNYTNIGLTIFKTLSLSGISESASLPIPAAVTARRLLYAGVH